MKNKLLKLFLLLAVIATMVVGTTAVCAAEDEEEIVDYTTKYFNVTVEAGKDNCYSITENILVDFGSGKHHVIYRTIPNQGVHIYDVYVPNFRAEESNRGEDVIIKIGQQDRYVTGEQEYTIKYKIQVVSNLTKATNFFRLNVLPHNWESRIDESHVHVLMPKNTDFSNLAIYSGPEGSKTNAAKSEVIVDNESGRTFDIYTSNLAPEEGVTVDLPLPEGYWEGEKTANWAMYFGIILLILIPLIILVIWLFVGRKPKTVKTVEFYPPENMTPGEVGFLVDGEVDRKDLTSMIIYFADKGYLSIKEYRSKKYLLRKEKEIDESEKLFAKTLFDGLFTNGDEVKLQELGKDFSRAFLNAKDFLSAERRIYSRKSVIGRGAAVVLIAILIEAIVGLTFLFEEYTSVGFIVGVPITLLAVVACVLIISGLDRRISDSRAKTLGKYIIGGILLVMIAGVVVATLLSYSIDNLLAAGFVISFGVSVLFMCNMLSRTKESAEDLAKVLGLREFIKMAEKPRLEKLIEEDPSYFFKIIPYAYVLGLSDKWIKDFDEIDIINPHWYNNEYDTNFVFNVFFVTSIMRGCDSALANSVVIPSRIDGIAGGFNGGSFSGGGFGGGGGGAW